MQFSSTFPGSRTMKYFSSLLFGSFLAAVLASPIEVSAYNYPVSEPFAATVVGTPQALQAQVPKKIRVKEFNLQVFPDRATPKLFWYNRGLPYSMAYQKDRAPLIFIISGTGSSYNSDKMQFLQKSFYQAGFHVVNISSTTHPDFIIAASENNLPGHLEDDARDLYRVMKLIAQRHQKDFEVSDYYLTGYSLGAAHSAFISKLDESEQAFNFKKVLLINPPVSLLNSVELLDDMAYNNIPGGIDNINAYLNDLIETFSEIYREEDDLEFDDDFLYTVYSKKLPEDTSKIAALVGMSFRLAAANMVFTSDVMTNAGYIVPKNRMLGSSDSLTNYSKVAYRIRFLQYFDELLYPYYKGKDASLTREVLLEKFSLQDIEDYLRNSDKIGLMHNADDLILDDGEIDYFKDVFQSRATIYPIGGHCGNIKYKQNIEDMLGFFGEVR